MKTPDNFAVARKLRDLGLSLAGSYLCAGNCCEDPATWLASLRPVGPGLATLHAAMERTSDTTGNYQVALANDELGYVSIPIAPGAKTPLVRWKRWQTERPGHELYRLWFTGENARNNIAIVCTGLVVFDVDDVAHLGKVLSECGDTPHKLLTPRGGVHLGYRRRQGVELHNQVDVKGLKIDIRTDGGLELIPSSSTKDGEYRWIGEGLHPASTLPVAKVGWTRERIRRVVTPVEIPELEPDRAMLARRARAYVAHIEGAISGQRGHDRTYRVACVLCHKFGLTPEEAFPLMWEWNVTSCEPAWSEKEVWHKLHDAWKNRR